MEAGLTSLQNIVNQHDRLAIKKDIFTLFTRKQYPEFQLEELAQHPLNRNNEQFRFFMEVLEEWNRKVLQGALPDHSELYYRQNIFIYNSLLHCIRAETSKNALPHLYQWFSVTRGAKNRPLGIKPQKAAIKDEQWDVRNTFKSNMPSEINSYKRRQLWSDITWQKQDKENEEDEKGTNSKEGLKDLTDKRLIEIEHEMVRNVVEAKQLEKAQGRWMMTNTRKQEEGIRSFLDGKFDANKTYFKTKPKRERNPLLTMVSEQRVKHSLGIRPKTVEVGRRVTTTASAGRLRGKQGEPRSTRNIKRVEEQEPEMGFEGVRVIDGTGLNVNPFEKKLKKKRAKK